jgi:hypothetical protein
MKIKPTAPFTGVLRLRTAQEHTPVFDNCHVQDVRDNLSKRHDEVFDVRLGDLSNL